MKNIFGDKIRDLKFFRFDFFEFDKKKFLISRSGFQNKEVMKFMLKM